MKKINIIKKNIDFSRIINNNKSFKYKDYIIYKEENNDKIYKFGISVSKKIGNAVVRNRLKRQIKSIIDGKSYENSFNCIIILRKGIIKKDFYSMKKELYDAFEILNIIKEDK